MNNKILLVEDELLTAMDVEDTLREAGWEVDGPFSSVRNTLGYLENNIPMCAVLDVRLEDGEVLPAADVLAQAGVPIVFHSGHASHDHLSSRYPEALFCDKPALPQMLAEVVERAIDRVRSHASAPEAARAT